MTDLYSLPEWNFVGGEYQRRSWTLYHPDGRLQDLATTTVSLAIDSYVDPEESPVVRKTTEVTTNEDGQCCYVMFELSPEDTRDLEGTYVYQLTFRQDARTMIPYRGMMHIARNIDKEALV